MKNQKKLKRRETLLSFFCNARSLLQLMAAVCVFLCVRGVCVRACVMCVYVYVCVRGVCVVCGTASVYRGALCLFYVFLIS